MKDNLLSFVLISNTQYYTKIWQKETHICKLSDQKFDFPIDFVHGAPPPCAPPPPPSIWPIQMNAILSVLKIPPCKLVYLLINLLALLWDQIYGHMTFTSNDTFKILKEREEKCDGTTLFRCRVQNAWPYMHNQLKDAFLCHCC